MLKKCSARDKIVERTGQQNHDVHVHMHKPPFQYAIDRSFCINSVQRLVPRSRLFRYGISRAFFSVSQGYLTTIIWLAIGVRFVTESLIIVEIFLL